MGRLIPYTNILTCYYIKLPYREFHFPSVNFLMCSEYNKLDVTVCKIDTLDYVSYHVSTSTLFFKIMSIYIPLYRKDS